MTEHFLAEYRAFAANGGSSAPGWLSALRAGAIARFAEVGFPTTHQEAWRFTSLKQIAETPFARGAMRWNHQSGTLPAGVRVSSLRVAGDIAQAHLGKYAETSANAMTALATAFLDDGMVVYVPARTVVPDPIRVAASLVAEKGRPMAPARLLIVLGDEAEATVVESYEDGGSATSFTNAVTEIVLGDGARLDHVRVQREGAGAYHIATTQSHQGRDSVLRSTSIALGGLLSRHDIGAVLAGTGASLILNGLSVLSGHQHVDHHTTIDHARPHCESHELFNGIFDQQSRGVFNGRIIVRPGAQRTDSKQTNNSLLLSEEARADSQPQLEIYADDVKCTHGATLGPLDATALFYLRSRGLGPLEARNLLTYGFGADVLSRIPVSVVREELDGVLRTRLGMGERAA